MAARSRFDLGFALNYQKLQLSERLTSSSALKDPLVLNLEGLVPRIHLGPFRV